ncbi:MAG: hypothetical protein OXU81_24625 [Gammaproteobacteria bacterium]|nr:hypothetical protein [Gammaproteobacteria bacterium]
MSDVIVERIELLAVGPDGEKVTWSSHLGPMYEAMVVARLFLSNDVEAIAGTTTYTEHEFDMATFSAASLMAPFVLGCDAFDISAAYADIRKRYVPLGHAATSLFDIALHDGKAKSVDQSIYKMLGAARHEVPAYASSLLLPTDQAYVDYCHDMLKLDYRAVKIHPYCMFDDDLRLVRILIEEFAGKDITLSLDVDGMYTFDQAHSMGKTLDNAGWDFFEAPLPDGDLVGYRKLADALDLDVVCGGNTLPNAQLIGYALGMGAWDRSRFDVTGIGGFTAAGDVAEITRAHGKTCEVQSWGYTLTQAANLHFMLAHPHCTCFEQAAPFEKYEFGARQVIRPDADGLVRPSDLPGLGVEMDWERIEPFVYARRAFST